MNNTYLASKQFLIAAGLLLATSSVQAALPLVEIKTYGQHIGGNIVYTHLVTNNSTCKIGNLDIAYYEDDTSNHGELSYVFPLGYTNMGSEEVDASSVSGLPNWAAQVIQVEDSGLYLNWNYRKDSNSPKGQVIFPGQTARFSVTVPKIDRAYVTGHFLAGLGQACSWGYKNQMLSLDTTPPVLTVTLTPATITAAQRGQMIPVTATITLKDDYDPAPEIKLVSIQTQGGFKPSDAPRALIGADSRSFQLNSMPYSPTVPRAYVLVFSATDASGNEMRVSVSYLM